MATAKSKKPSDMAQIKTRHLTLSLFAPPGKSTSQTYSRDAMKLAPICPLD